MRRGGRDKRDKQWQKKKEANFHNERGPAKKAPFQLAPRRP
jgi:hypothetical protein